MNSPAHDLFDVLLQDRPQTNLEISTVTVYLEAPTEQPITLMSDVEASAGMISFA